MSSNTIRYQDALLRSCGIHEGGGGEPAAGVPVSALSFRRPVRCPRPEQVAGGCLGMESREFSRGSRRLSRRLCRRLSRRFGAARSASLVRNREARLARNPFGPFAQVQESQEAASWERSWPDSVPTCLLAGVGHRCEVLGLDAEREGTVCCRM